MQQARDAPTEAPIICPKSKSKPCFKTLGEAMIECWLVLEKFLQNQLKMETLHVPEYMREHIALYIGENLDQIKIKLEQGLFKTPYDVHAEVVCFWRNCHEKHAETQLARMVRECMRVHACVYVSVRMCIWKFSVC
jgi:hypothetical protein